MHESSNVASTISFLATRTQVMIELYEVGFELSILMILSTDPFPLLLEIRFINDTRRFNR